MYTFSFSTFFLLLLLLLLLYSFIIVVCALRIIKSGTIIYIEIDLVVTLLKIFPFFAFVFHVEFSIFFPLLSTEEKQNNRKKTKLIVWSLKEFFFLFCFYAGCIVFYSNQENTKEIVLCEVQFSVLLVDLLNSRINFYIQLLAST